MDYLVPAVLLIVFGTIIGSILWLARRKSEKDLILVPNNAIEKLSLQLSKAERLLDIYKRSDKVRYLQVQAINEGDPEKEYADGDVEYQKWVSELLDNPRFQWFMYKRQMEFVDIMNQIPNSDPKTDEMRVRAAHRMDGVCRLIDTMAAIKRAYLISKEPKQQQEGIG